MSFHRILQCRMSFHQILLCRMSFCHYSTM
jgi:hypothetical protein